MTAQALTRAAEPVPLIIGAGLGGLLISDALSRAGVRHVLTGVRASADAAPLGESLDFSGSLDLPRLVPEAAHLLGPKARARFYGPLRLELPFHFHRMLDHPMFRSYYWLMGLGDSRRTMWHVDRVRLDALLFEKVTRSPFTRWVPGRVGAIAHDAASDRITGVTLEGGEELRTSHVFDVTGPARLLCRTLKLPTRDLSGPKRAFYVRRTAPEGRPGRCEGWLEETGLVRICARHHGHNGVAWVIPAGDEVGVGGVLDGELAELDPEATLGLIEDIVEGLGLPLRATFPQRSAVTHHPMRFYGAERGYGANWLLVAGAHSSTHFISSSGVGACTGAARLAVPFLRNPRRAGARYHATLAYLASISSLFDHMLQMMSREELDEAVVMPWIRDNMVRVFRYVTLLPGLSPRTLGPLFLHATRSRLLFEPQVRLARRYLECTVRPQAPV